MTYAERDLARWQLGVCRRLRLSHLQQSASPYEIRRLQAFGETAIDLAKHMQVWEVESSCAKLIATRRTSDRAFRVRANANASSDLPLPPDCPAVDPVGVVSAP